eukprot:gene10237-2657_t
MKKKEFWIFVVLSILIFINAYIIPEDHSDILNTAVKVNVKMYYKNISPKQKNFKQKLHGIISKHKKLPYHKVWSAFEQLDTNEKCGRGIEDIYSKNCWLPGNQRKGGQQCNRLVYRENQCYNREHSWPKSWWGGSQRLKSYTDLHHLFPTDGYVNFRRGNLPLGEVIAPIRFQSTNGAKVGKCRHNPRKLCFEPSFEYHGDLARVYFYMSFRYMNDFKCCKKEGIRNSEMEPWLLNTLKKWHVEDPVSSKEKRRNDKIHMIQGNRNPFVDHPNWVEKIKF